MDYNTLVAIERLFQAWEEFRKGKRKKPDVQIFERNLEDNLFKLHADLVSKKYKHSSYEPISKLTLSYQDDD